MYLMYVDESGDPGISNSPTQYFILSGLVIHELSWNNFLDELINFRKSLKNKTGLRLEEEIHAVDFINRPGDLKRIKRNDRVDILKQSIKWLSAVPYLNIINVIVNKKDKTGDIFENAWRTLIQRFENTLNHRNFRGPSNPQDTGLVLPDRTDAKKLVQLLRKMRRFNTIPNTGGIGYRNLPINFIIEDPYFKDSAESFIIQMLDVISYTIRQKYEPNKYFTKKAGRTFFKNLLPILCTQASTRNEYGFVEL